MKCTQCRTDKPITEFTERRQNTCTPCADKQRAYHQAHKLKIAERNGIYYRLNKKQIIEQHAARFQAAVPVGQVRCSGCGVGKPLTEFMGITKRCNSCREKQHVRRQINKQELRDKARRYYLNNKEEILEKGRKYRRNNPESECEKNRKYRERNREKIAEAGRKYYEEHCAEITEKARKYREINKEVTAEYARAYWITNKEKIRKACRKYREEHPEKIIAIRNAYKEINRTKSRAYYHAHPEDYKTRARNRRALLQGMESRHSREDIQWLHIEQGGRCEACREPLKKTGQHVDHIIPLIRGGRNDRSNLQLFCPRCNLSKGSMPPDVWFAKLGRLPLMSESEIMR